MTSLKLCRLVGRVVFAVALLLFAAAGPARGAAIVTTTFGSDQVVIYPTPNTDTPNPTAIPVSGVPAGAHPHGVSCFDPDTCLVADSGNFRVLVVQVSTASVVDTIATGAPINYPGAGTIAVNPDKTFALAIAPFFLSGQLTVIAAPFGSGSAVTKIPLAGSSGAAGTQAIAFAPGGQAFVCNGGNIAVVDPPYAAIAFTIVMPTGTSCGELAMTPAGTLLAPFGKVVSVFTAPIVFDSVPATLQIPDAGGLAGAAVTADGSTALVVDVNGTALWAISAPFGAASPVEKIALPPVFSGLRQIAISPDTQLAVAAGGGGSNPHAAFVRPPFTAAGASVFDVFILGGIGSGGVNFLGNAGPPGPPPPPCTPVSAASLGAGLTRLPAEVGDPVPLVAAILPASRSVRLSCPATAFVTVINAGAETATGVGIAPAALIAADFLYQTTDPLTNALTGTANTPVPIQPLQAQSFVIALTPRAPFGPTDVTFDFGGINSAPVAPIIGLNTFLLTASASDTPDVVALGATAGNTGIVDLPAATNTGAFAVATANVGLGASITASADTGAAVLPVILTVCQTDPGSGLCLAPPATSVTTFIAGGATPTFAFFAIGQGAVAFDPAANRVFARFKDDGGITRGSTSVAIRTTD